MSGRNVDPTVAHLRARVAAHTKWARTDDRVAATAAARQAAEDRWLRLAREQFGDLPPDELARRAEHLKSAHFARLALKSVQARRRRAAA
jgi:hypothetical protein